MSSRVNWYFRQRVQENELDLAFDQLEQADRDLAADLRIFGVVAGAEPTPHQPVPDLRLLVTGPARAYDRLGRRIFVPVHTTVDLERDLNGLPTAVTTPGNVRWVSVFLRFSRVLSDPRIDGGGQQVFFRREESFEFVVRQAPEALPPDASRPALEPDELLVCDVLRGFGQTQILADHIDAQRRQKFFFAQGENVGVIGSDWTFIDAHAADVQAAFNSLDREIQDHVSGASRKHHAGDIRVDPPGFLDSPHVQGALDQLVGRLMADAPGAAGAGRIGADAVAGSPFAMLAGTVDAQLAQLNANLNSHANSTTAHPASSISAATHGHISATNVQGQLQEIVSDLGATGGGTSGAERVGVEAMSGTPTSLPAGTLRSQLSALLSALNGHVSATSGAHSASAIGVADVNNRYNAQTVEGALGEALEAFEGDHFRVNQSDAGQHRTIRQPVLATDIALLWDAKGIGHPTGRMRVYSDDTGIWITLNAAFTTSGIAKDSSGSSSALQLTKGEFRILQHEGTGTTFTAWSRTWSLGINSGGSTTGWRLTGSGIQESGRVGMEAANPSSQSALVAMGASVTFRSRFPAAPSSVTLSTITSTGVSGLPSIQNIDENGFHASHSASVSGNSNIKWVGRYTAVS